MKTLPDIHVLDLAFLNEPSVIAAFLIDSGDGLVLVETGPERTFAHLQAAIVTAGFDPKDLRHVLLTHIHFDHAGAAWKLARQGAKIYVHPIGIPHLRNPGRLWNSARMIYGDDMDYLWGSMEPIDENLLIPADDGDHLKIGTLDFNVHYTPGHAIHHNTYQLEDILFTGDVAGVKINNGPVVPPCPPPDINIEQWKTSIGKLKQQHPGSLYLTHFGRIEDPQKHFSDLERMLDDWAGWIKPYFDDRVPAGEVVPRFMEYTKNYLVRSGVSDQDISSYDKANPSWMSVNGLLRYWKLKAQGRI